MPPEVPLVVRLSISTILLHARDAIMLTNNAVKSRRFNMWGGAFLEVIAQAIRCRCVPISTSRLISAALWLSERACGGDSLLTSICISNATCRAWQKFDPISISILHPSTGVPMVGAIHDVITARFPEDDRRCLRRGESARLAV